MMYGDRSPATCLLTPEFAWLLSSRLPSKQVRQVHICTYTHTALPKDAMHVQKLLCGLQLYCQMLIYVLYAVQPQGCNECLLWCAE